MLNNIKLRTSFIAIFILVMPGLFNVGECYAQFLADVRLTNDPFISSTSYNNARCVAANGSVVHVVWHDARNTVNNYEIYYKRSTDRGVSWGADTRLTNTNNSSSELACVSVSGTTVHVVWLDYRDGNGEIYYKLSTDEGVNWEPDTRLTNNTSESQVPSLSVTGTTLHVVWYDLRDLNYEIYYKRSTDAGATWGTDTRLTNSTGSSYNPCAAVSGQVVHVVWYDNRDGNDEIYYKRSTDGGTTWAADSRLTNNTSISQRPSVAVTGQVVQVLWTDFRDGDAEIYQKRSTDGGVTWGADTRLTNSIGDSYNPCVTVTGTAAHVVWYDNRAGNQEIYYKRSTDEGLSWDADTRLTTNAPGISFLPSISVSGTDVHVVWSDDRNSNYEIYYKRDPDGNPVGITNINSETPQQFYLSQNYPNPFNPVTNIEFSIPKQGNVRLTIYNVIGNEVSVLVNKELAAGNYKVDFNASSLASGIYFYMLAGENYSDTKKMIIIK